MFEYEEKDFLFPGELSTNEAGFPSCSIKKAGFQSSILVAPDGEKTIEVLFSVDEHVTEIGIDRTKTGIKKIYRNMDARSWSITKDEFSVWANKEILRLKDEYQYMKNDQNYFKLGY